MGFDWRNRTAWQRVAKADGARPAASCTAGTPDSLVKLLRMSEVAGILDVSTARAYELARQGVLPTIRFGRQVRIDPRALDRWLRSGGQVQVTP